MRKAIIVLVITAFVAMGGPRGLLAGGGEGSGSDNTLRSQSAVQFLLATQAIQFVLLVSGTQISFAFLYLDAENLPAPVKVRAKKTNWSSGSSNTASDEGRALAENLPDMQAIGHAYRFNESVVIGPISDTPGTNLSAELEENGDASVRYIETDGKGNSDIYLLPPRRVNFTVDSDEAWKHFSNHYEDFENKMDEAEHVGDVDYGWDEQNQIHVIRTTFKF